jgi:hypothetical protein
MTRPKKNKILNNPVKKFDVTVGNPPYQKISLGKSHAIWDLFVQLNFNLTKQNGYSALIHPAGWRNVSGRFRYIWDLLISKQLIYLEIHGVKDGLKVFRASTRYDWYVAKNTSRYDDQNKI